MFTQLHKSHHSHKPIALLPYIPYSAVADGCGLFKEIVAVASDERNTVLNTQLC